MRLEGDDLSEAKLKIMISVKSFARRMQNVLTTHAPEKGTTWETEDICWLMSRCAEELGEVDEKLMAGDYVGVMMESIDVANLAMMIYERAQLIKEAE